MSHAELQELLGAYALDAVDADEAALVDAHLAECPRCRAEVAELREVAGLLGQSGSDAPEGVWDRIASSLGEVPPPLRLEVQRERRNARSRWRSVGLAIAGAASVVLVLLAVSVVNLRNHVDDLEHNRGTDVALAAQQALTEPGARVAHLSGTTGVAASAVVRSNGQGYVLAASLPTLTGHIYELWGASAAGQIVSLGTIPGPGVYAFTADGSIRQIMVTEEVSPVPAPTGSPLVAGVLA